MPLLNRKRQCWMQLPYPAGPWIHSNGQGAENSQTWNTPLNVKLSQRVAFGVVLFVNTVHALESDFDSVKRVRGAQGDRKSGPRVWPALVQGRWQYDLGGNPYKAKSYKGIGERNEETPGWQRIIRIAMLFTFAKLGSSLVCRSREEVLKTWKETVDRSKRVVLRRPAEQLIDPLELSLAATAHDTTGQKHIPDQKRAWCGYFLRVFLHQLALQPKEFELAFLPELIQILRLLVRSEPTHAHASVAAMVARELSEMKEHSRDVSFSNWITETTPNSPINTLFNHTCLTLDVNPDVVGRWIEINGLGWQVGYARMLHDLAQTVAAMLTDPISYGLMFSPKVQGMNARHPAQRIFIDASHFKSVMRPRRTQRGEGFPPSMDWNVFHRIRVERLWHWPWMVAWLSNPESEFQIAMRKANLVTKTSILGDGIETDLLRKEFV